MKNQLHSWKTVKKLLSVRRNKSSNLAYKQRLLFEKSKESDKFKEMYKKNGVCKTCKSVRKVSKTQSGHVFKQF